MEAEPVLGWRPAAGQVVPNTQWVLEEHLGYGGFGEVWLGRHQKLKEQRVFKFCFRADRVRSLKREVTLFRLLKERIGGHPNIVGVQEVFFRRAAVLFDDGICGGPGLGEVVCGAGRAGAGAAGGEAGDRGASGGRVAGSPRWRGSSIGM